MTDGRGGAAGGRQRFELDESVDWGPKEEMESWDRFDAEDFLQNPLSATVMGLS